MKQKLSRRRIAETTIGFLAEHGLDKLSMRKLAARLGVEAMSLYNHVRNKEDLLDAVHERLLEDLSVPTPDNNWREQVKSTARSFSEMLRANPGAIPLFATRSAIAPGSLEVVDASVSLLMKAGFGAQQSLMTFQTIFAYVMGHAIFHYSEREPESWASQAAYAAYPALSQVATLEYTPEEELEFALDLLLAGIGALGDRVQPG